MFECDNLQTGQESESFRYVYFNHQPERMWPIWILLLILIIIIKILAAYVAFNPNSRDFHLIVNLNINMI